MPYDAPQSFLELRAGPYRLALDAHSVVAVLNDVCGETGVVHDEEPLAYVDLGPLLTGAARGTAPFAVVFDSRDGRAALGVDGVDHFRPGEQAAERPVPAFGLTHPGLFRGALLVDDGLVLLLEPTAVAQLTASKERDI